MTSVAAKEPVPEKPARGQGTSARSAPRGQSGGDNRQKMLEATMKRHQYQSDSLIEVLHTAQELFGFLDTDLLLHVAHSLKVPPSRVFGVATFYHFFSLKPQGEHTCVICMGTACYVKGASKLVAAAEALCGVKSGETTRDGKVSLMTARCLGACGIAPAVVLDGTVVGHETPEALTERVKGWLG